MRWPRFTPPAIHGLVFNVDQGIYGHVTRCNLAVLAAERGDHAEVRRLWEAVLAECPGDREARAKLGLSAERSGRDDSNGRAE
jgi:hypothetical protein